MIEASAPAFLGASSFLRDGAGGVGFAFQVWCKSPIPDTPCMPYIDMKCLELDLGEGSIVTQWNPLRVRVRSNSGAIE